MTKNVQRTYQFVVADVVAYNRETKKNETVTVKISSGLFPRITMSDFVMTDELIIKAATKTLKTPILDCLGFKYVYELRVMPDEKFYQLSTLEKVSDTKE
ncbi:MAG: hypothetical protein J6S67_08185 [Methanobrevibacter sp.]|nr:hypothetical protein [Methanobrevibacter sp.]